MVASSSRQLNTVTKIGYELENHNAAILGLVLSTGMHIEQLVEDSYNAGHSTANKTA